ncbi:hypothetical protein WA026_021955 [Henosepilachna vigintioctopunctata]|uniref:Uncharacterized protein n=1 Tax=Henosepilachna vigintioctopunctata TaxID=420089 RepID=A0AAW1VDA1_9CUCU
MSSRMNVLLILYIKPGGFVSQELDCLDVYHCRFLIRIKELYDPSTSNITQYYYKHMCGLKVYYYVFSIISLKNYSEENYSRVAYVKHDQCGVSIFLQGINVREY